MACNYESLEEQILNMLFDDQEEKKQYNGFNCVKAEEIEREFEEDDSNFADLLLDEDCFERY